MHGSQISDHHDQKWLSSIKHQTNLNEKLYTKLLEPVANRNTKLMFTKTGRLFLS